MRVREALRVSSILWATFGAAACSQTTQSAPTPASGSGVGTVSQASSTSSSAGPWKSTTSTPSPASVESLTTPMDAAMVLCTTVLNLEPCGLITTGVSDMLGCFAACQMQIQTVATFSVERAAIQCALSTPPSDDGARECNLGLPAGAALDLEALGKRCGARCKELADAQSRSFAP